MLCNFQCGVEFRHGASESQKPFPRWTTPEVIHLPKIISILVDTIVRSTSVFELENLKLKMISSAI